MEDETESPEISTMKSQGRSRRQEKRSRSRRKALLPWLDLLEPRTMLTVYPAMLVSDINPGPASSNPANGAALNGLFYFAANDGTDGTELWQSDGTTSGTSMVADINPGAGSSYPANLTAVGNTLFFTAIINDEAELWESDGTASGTTEVTSTNFGSFGQLIGIGGELYFTADDANGQLSLWQSDGTSAGTTILVDATGPADLINIDGSLEWVQYVPGSDGQQQQVGSYDPQAAPGDQFQYFTAPTDISGLGDLTYAAGTTFLVASVVGNPNYTGSDLFILNDWNPIPISGSPTNGSDPYDLTSFNGKLYFGAFNSTYGQELFSATQQGAELFSDINPGPASSSPSNLTVVGNVLYFSAFDGQSENLYQIDGAGDLTDVAAMPGNAIGSSFTGVGNSLFFTVPDALWISDGTSSGTQQVSSFVDTPTDLTNDSGGLFFTANDGTHGDELWEDQPTPFSVTTSFDRGPGSIRNAIDNVDAGVGDPTITFAIGTGQQTIDVLSALPAITNPTIIDGTTQPGYSGTPLIELNGAEAGSGVNGLTIAASDVTVQGLVISGFGGYGILVTGDDALIENSYIGTDPTGTIAEGNSGGVWVVATGDTIGGTSTDAGNVISGNRGDGITLVGSDSTLIQGNKIGTDVSGINALGNSAHGILAYYGGSGDTIGGTSPAARNIIAANGSVFWDGIELFGVADNLVEGNYVGTDVTGTIELGNGDNGVDFLNCNSSTVGGTVSGAGNLISSNSGSGIIDNGSGNVVEGNRIGTDSSGSKVLANAYNGIIVVGADDGTIGGTAAGASNLISGNVGDGIDILQSSGYLVEGNLIGTDLTGATALGNSNAGVELGVSIEGNEDNTIGGSSSASRNLISGNAFAGVLINGPGTDGQRRRRRI